MTSDSALSAADLLQKSTAQQTTEEQQMAEALQLSLAESFKTAEQDEVKLENPLAREPTSGTYAFYLPSSLFFLSLFTVHLPCTLKNRGMYGQR